jgi:hypothetical protein
MVWNGPGCGFSTISASEGKGFIEGRQQALGCSIAVAYIFISVLSIPAPIREQKGRD